MSKLGDFELFIDEVHLSRCLSLLFSDFLCCQNGMSLLSGLGPEHQQGTHLYKCWRGNSLPRCSGLGACFCESQSSHIQQREGPYSNGSWVIANHSSARLPVCKWALPNGPLMAHVAEIWLGYFFLLSHSFHRLGKSQVIKCRYWSCSITSTLLTPCQGPRATRQTCGPNLKDGKSQLGRGRAWREWGYTPADNKELRNIKISSPLQGTQNWYHEGEGEVFACERKKEWEVQGRSACCMGSIHWGFHFKSNADVEAF